MSGRIRNPYFDFKQFRIVQHQAAMRVTTHACVFGALIDLQNAKRILDIGAGTGLLTLMMAQRSNGCFSAVEMDEGAFADLRTNVQQSPWSERCSLYHQTIQSFAAQTNERFDCIVSNPPFFNQSLGANNPARHLARHDDHLPLHDLLALSAQLLNDDGTLWLLLPDTAQSRLFETAKRHGFHLTQQIELKNTPKKPADRMIFAFVRQAQPRVMREITIYQAHPHYSEEAKVLLEPYYASL